jgi:peptidoglycan/xylan/chitin deacetylase (PgdA/CDA1 family)
VAKPARLIYRTLNATGVTAWRRRVSEGAPVFCFHNVVMDGLVAIVGDRSLHVGISAFRQYIDWINSNYRVVSLNTILARIGERRPVRGMAAITFDDAYQGVFLNAVPELAARRMPSTVFVISGAASSPAPFWWDIIGDSSMLSREDFLDRLQGDAARILERITARPQLPPECLPADWTMICASLALGVELGAHTASHPNLAVADPDVVERELSESREVIRRCCGVTPVVAAYPYGRTTPVVLEAARAVGFRGGVGMEYGLANSSSDPWRLPRVNIPAGIDLAELSCFASGLRMRPPR